ncbi:MAG: PadR family transcriptional regulator [Euryarchaeota archaeon]|nr:PadR family transcriptional regulator [Euryarchaeota archaeon]
MSLSRLAILGALMERPMHGYELRKYFEEAQGVFWMINYGSIYPTLKRLEKEGLVKGRAEPAGRVGGRITYAITKKGEAEFLRTLEERLKKEAFVRDEFTLHLFFLDHLDGGTIREVMEKKLEGNLAVLECIKRLDEELKGTLPRYRYEAVRRGRMHLETEISWLKSTLENPLEV